MSELDIDARIQELEDQAGSLPASLARLALYEEAVRLSDLTKNLKQQYRLRKFLINDSVYCDRYELSLVAFAWCWAQSKAAPKKFPRVNLLWEYKWIINSIWMFPQISKTEIERHYDEMEQAYREHGSTLQVVYYWRMDGAMNCGHMEVAAKCYELYQNTARDRWSDCHACERNNLIEFYALTGQDQQAIDSAKDLLNGRYSCTSVPESTYSKLMIPYLRLGKPDQALAMHRRGYAQIKSKPGYGGSYAVHLQTLALTGNWSEGWKLFKKHLAESWNASVPWRRYEFLRGASFFLNNYPRSAGRPPALRVPPEMNLGETKKLIPLPDVAAAVTAEARALAASFDHRNGNRAQQDDLDKQQELWKYAVDLPLTEKSRESGD
jgi:hypothetical protein